MTGLKTRPDPRVKISEFILKHRWLLVAMMALLFNGFEIIEHLHEPNAFLDPNYIRETVFFGVFSPLLTGAILTLLARTESERVRVVWQSNLEHELSKELGKAKNWDELVTSLVMFPSNIAPFVATSLLVNDLSQTHLEKVAEWRHPKWERVIIPDIMNYERCSGCFKVRIWKKIDPDACPYVPATNERLVGYCLPLVNGNKPTALLHLFLPANDSLTDDQINILNNVAPSMAFAIDTMNPNSSNIIWTTATEAERRRLARYLHDSLGQNLGFLTLKLDQLRGDDVLHEVDAIRRELAQMHNVANQAYEQVRSTLTSLQPQASTDLSSAIHEQTAHISQRARLTVHANSAGSPQTLPAHIQHKVLGILREALANVEKHANAQNVYINQIWKEQGLTIKVRDDGQGFSSNSDRDGHYGLTIMQERAQEINGSLTISSSPNAGTEITLQFPIPPNS